MGHEVNLVTKHLKQIGSITGCYTRSSMYKNFLNLLYTENGQPRHPDPLTRVGGISPNAGALGIRLIPQVYDVCFAPNSRELGVYLMCLKGTSDYEALQSMMAFEFSLLLFYTSFVANVS